MTKYPMLAAGAAVLLIGVASAQTASVKQVFEQYRLLGTFSLDCSKPASSTNSWHVLRPLGDTQVQYDLMIGPTERGVVRVFDAAGVRAPNEVNLSMQAETGRPRADLVVRVENNRWRVMERVENGKPIISQGRLTSGNKAELAWLNRCG